MRNWTIFTSLLLILSGCNSTGKASNNEILANSNFGLSEQQISAPLQDSALYKVINFETADHSSVILPYLDALNEIDGYTEEQTCAPKSLQVYDDLIALNPSTIYIRAIKLACIKHQLSDDDYYEELSDITDIAAVLLKSGNGESFSSAIEIRELSEIYPIFEQAGLTVLDTEVEFNNGVLYYKLHCLDTETNQFIYRYASSIKFFSKVFSKLTGSFVTTQQASTFLFDTLRDGKAVVVMPYMFLDMALNGNYEEIIQFQEEVQSSAVGQIRLAHAALSLERDDILDKYLDNILNYADQDLVEANSFIAHFLFIKDPEQSWPEIRTALAKIDSLAGEGIGMRLFLESLMFRSDFAAQLETLLNLSDKTTLAALKDFAEYLQAIEPSTPRNLTPKINELLAVLANHNEPESQLLVARQIFAQEQPLAEDLIRARQLLESSAAAGYVEAQLSLGLKYGKGIDGFPENKNKAFELYKLAAEQNNIFALHNIAAYYRYGLTVEVNLHKAIEYYEKATAGGLYDGHCLIGDVYRIDLTPPDFIKAEEHYNKAIQAPQNSTRLVNCYEGLGILNKETFNHTDKAIDFLQQAVELGSGFAAYNIAVIYDFAKYNTQNYGKALEYYEKAIELDYPEAGANLGFMYEAGKGELEADNEKALHYYQLGAEAKHPQAMNNLGTFYLEGIAIAKDINKGLALYKEAADLGNDFASENYGDILWEGELLPGNYIEACNYYQIAYEQQFKDAYPDLAFCYSYGAGRHKNLDKALQILEEGIALGFENLYHRAAEILLEKEQDQKAESYLLQSMDAGILNGYAPLASLYLEQERYEEALKIYQQGIKDGEDFMPDIAKMQWHGQGMEQDKEAAIEKLKAQAKKTGFDPNHYLGDSFQFGYMGEPDYEQAFYYYSQIQEPDSVVVNILGEMYRYGWHVEKDLAKAADYYQQSARQGHAHAYFNLGEMYRDGDYYHQDPEEAASWFIKSAEAGLKTAMIEVSKLYMDGSATEPKDKNAEYWLRKADWENDENALLLAELQLSKSNAEANKEGVYWLTLAVQSQAQGADALMQKMGITKEDLIHD